MVLQPKLKQAEFFSTTGRTADSIGTGDPGVQTRRPRTSAAATPPAFIEDGDWISFNPYNLEDLDRVTFRVASGGAGGTIELQLRRRRTARLVAATPNIAPTGGWQTWKDVTIDLPDTVPAGTHRLFVVFRHPTATGSLMNLNWFRFTRQGRRGHRAARGHGDGHAGDRARRRSRWRSTPRRPTPRARR